MIGDGQWTVPAALPWMDDAACTDVDPDLFFPAFGQRADAAKAVCGGCAVREQCLAYALEKRVRFGVWGGLSPQERGVHDGAVRSRGKSGRRVDVGLIAHYVGEGLTDGEVARRVGCNPKTVLLWRKERGIKPNSPRGRRSR